MAAVRGMVSGARLRRGDAWVGTMLGRAGIAPELLQEPQARVTGEQYVLLFRLLMDELGDECLNLLPHPLRRGSFALIARSSLGAPTAGVALERIARGFDLLLPDVQVSVLHEPGITGLAWTLRGGVTEVQNYLYEMLVRTSWRLLGWLHGGRLMPVRCDFSFARPDYAHVYARIFPGPLRFEQPCSVAWFSHASLSIPVRREAAALERFLAGSPGNVLLPRLAERVASTRVQALLQRSDGPWPDLEGTAQSLHMSVSTLQRHLAQEGTSFQALKDKLRRDLAIVRLNTSALPLAVIAAELGFSDSTTFQRAFKTWTGSPPGWYREHRNTAASDTPPAQAMPSALSR